MVLAVGLTGLQFAAGCSSSKAGTSPGTSGTGTEIKVGTAPTLAGTSFYLAAQDGTFTKNHLAATPQLVTSGAQAIPLLLNGQIQEGHAKPALMK
jgi:ABC-type nitrate/sulfonate/bicarbonate transport system substrate-binding protein